MKYYVVFISIVIIFFNTSLRAAEYDNIFISARALSMGAAQTAISDDHASIYYNPACMTNVPEGTFAYFTLLYAHSDWIQADLETSLAGEGSMEMPRDIFSPTPAAITNFGLKNFRAGLGLFGLTGFASFTDADKGAKRFAQQESVIVTSSLSPSFAYRFFDKLSIGFSMNLFLFKKFTSVVSFGDPSRDVKLGEISLKSEENFDTRLWPSEHVEAGLEEVGYNIGILYKPFDFLSLGFDYQEEVDIEFEGDYKRDAFPFFPLPVPSHKTDFETTLTIPRKFLFGIGLFPIEGLTIAFDVQYTMWGEIDEMVIKLEEPDLFFPAYSSGKAVTKTGYEDTLSLRFGVAYETPLGLIIRAGYHRDNGPSREEYWRPGRTSDLNIYSLGFTYGLTDSLILDMVGLYGNYENLEVSASENKTPFALLFGDMKTDDYFFNTGIQFTYRF